MLGGAVGVGLLRSAKRAVGSPEESFRGASDAFLGWWLGCPRSSRGTSLLAEVWGTCDGFGGDALKRCDYECKAVLGTGLRGKETVS